MYKVLIYEPDICRGTVILLVGRDGRAADMMRYYRGFSGLNQTRFIAVEPLFEWYPAPRGPDDQQEAIQGMELSVSNFDEFLTKLEDDFQINRSQIALVGFSAGAVMGIQLVAYSAQPFAAVVSHHGAILAPENLAIAKHSTPVLLIHSKNDSCFDWNERYLPMKTALQEKGYFLDTHEKEDGDHLMEIDDVSASAIFLAKIFQYPPDWTPSIRYME